MAVPPCSDRETSSHHSNTDSPCDKGTQCVLVYCRFGGDSVTVVSGVYRKRKDRSKRKKQEQAREKHDWTGLRPIASGKIQLLYNGPGRFEIVL